MKPYEYELSCIGGDVIGMCDLPIGSVKRILTQKQYDRYVNYKVASAALDGLTMWLSHHNRSSLRKDRPAILNDIVDDWTRTSELMQEPNGGPFHSKYDFRSTWEVTGRRRVGSKRWQR